MSESCLTLSDSQFCAMTHVVFDLCGRKVVLLPISCYHCALISHRSLGLKRRDLLLIRWVCAWWLFITISQYAQPGLRAVKHRWYLSMQITQLPTDIYPLHFHLCLHILRIRKWNRPHPTCWVSGTTWASSSPSLPSLHRFILVSRVIWRQPVYINSISNHRPWR